MDEGIWVETMVASRTGEPAVVLRWYDHSGELSPKEARAFAMTVLEAADAAESDAFLCKFAVDKIGLDKQRMAHLLNEFRKYREEQAAR